MDSLQPPRDDYGAAPPRRKRGLSLRLQLLSKSVALHNPFERIELANIGNGAPKAAAAPAEHGAPAAGVPQIQVEFDKYPYAQVLRLTTHLTADLFLTERLARLGRRRRARRTVAGLIGAVTSKFFRKTPVRSERGRLVPVCAAKEHANALFQDEFYSAEEQGYVDERTGCAYVDNAVTLSRYTVWTFLPKQLKAQFSKVANCYFMVVAIMQMIPSWLTTGRFTTIIPLLVFMLVLVAREGYDDWRRHSHDKEENATATRVVAAAAELPLPSPNSLQHFLAELLSFSSGGLARHGLRAQPRQWRDVAVGDIVEVREGEWVPADLVLLAVDGDEAYVETMALDGETNLKTRVPHVELLRRAAAAGLLRALAALLTVEDPNPNLYSFEGHFTVDGTQYALGPEHVAYRGSVLRNTRAVLGVAVFTGEESKIRMNNLRDPRTKAPKLQRNINLIVLFMILVVALLAAFSTMAQRLQRGSQWYLEGEDAGVAATLMGFIIMYNTLIPLSLYVTMEIVKVMQLLFLQYDIDMYHEESNTPADAKTATILEELGQVLYVFSDKTGTLTDNVMVFRKFSVAGLLWVHRHRRTLLQHIQAHPNSLFARRVTFFLLSLALCHTCQPRASNALLYLLDSISEEPEVSFQLLSPDELALVEAAAELGFVAADRKNGVVTVRTFPEGPSGTPQLDEYEVLDVVDFSLARKRMLCVVRFPDGRIALFCKGADNVILERLANADVARAKQREISLNSTQRKQTEAEHVLQARLLEETLALARLGSIDTYLDLGLAREVQDIAREARRLLHLQQQQRYSIQESSNIPSDKLLVNDEYLMEKTLEHVEEYSSEGLRTLLYLYRWVPEEEHARWLAEYHEAKMALVDRAARMEEVGAKIEGGLELLGATAIEDKLQEGVSDAIDKLRRAGIKMWMLTGDKRETAISIGYACRLIKDYSTVVVLSLDEGLEALAQLINTASQELDAVAHGVVVVDGETLAAIEADPTLLLIFLELCILVELTLCCRALPAQKAHMVDAVRALRPREVTLAVGDGANDIAMIQSADIGVGITGKEGLNAARLADYAVAQFRFLLKLLLVNGRYNYVRTCKFVLCTFYKELLFYLTQCCYQRFTRFTGTLMYELWLLLMFNTLFTSLCVVCIGMFDKDLRPLTLLAVPELYATGRCYRAFNLPVFVTWMVVATLQSVGVTFLACYLWGFLALKDNTTLPLGTMVFFALVISINGKILFLEMRNRQWLAFVSFILLVGGYGLWNVLIMGLHRMLQPKIYYADYGLLHFGRDITWWATLLLLFVVLLLFDLLVKVFKFMVRPGDTELFQLYERDLELRRLFEEKAMRELRQGWFFARDGSTTKKLLCRLLAKVGIKLECADEDPTLAQARKRAGTNPMSTELPPSGDGEVVTREDGYEVLPSGARVKVRPEGLLTRLGKRFNKEEDVDEIIDKRLKELGN